MKTETERNSEVSTPLGLVHSVESCGTVDGPGVRFILFLSGCSLRCRYCHNPDTSFVRRGKERSADEVLEEISRYAAFMKAAGGGVTISGGDPLFQPRFTRAILKGCKAQGLHTCIDTSGHLGASVDDEMLEDIDLVLLDIKAWNPEVYQELVKQPLQPTLDFAERLAAAGKPMWLRYVLVPGITDNPADVEKLARYAAGEEEEYLEARQMGPDKRYHWSSTHAMLPLSVTCSAWMCCHSIRLASSSGKNLA